MSHCRWYSFDYGMVHYLVYNSETDFDYAPDFFGGYENFCGSINDPNCQGPFIEPSADNYYIQWVENDLRNVDRTVTPWYATTCCLQCTTCVILTNLLLIVSLSQGNGNGSSSMVC